MHIHSDGRVSELLLSLLKHDSRTGGGGGRSVLLYLREYMSAAGVQDLHIESEDRSPFLYARIPGATSNLKGLLMFSHADTADWDEHAWSRSPLGETDLDGRIYGRGALDCKSLVAVQTHILVTLARRRVPPSRDVGLVITTDEETGGYDGMGVFCKNHERLTRFHCALGEGGGYILSATGKAAVTCQIGECGRVEYSLPHSPAVPAGLVDIPIPRMLLAELRRPDSLHGLRHLSSDAVMPSFSIRDGSGILRVPPGYDRDAIVARLVSQRLLPPDVTGREIAGSYMSLPRGRLYRSICRLVRRTGRRLVPAISPGYGDGRFLRERGLKTFGFFPVGIRESVTSIHGADEHIHRATLDEACDSLLMLVTETVGL